MNMTMEELTLKTTRESLDKVLSGKAMLTIPFINFVQTRMQEVPDRENMTYDPQTDSYFQKVSPNTKIFCSKNGKIMFVKAEWWEVFVELQRFLHSPTKDECLCQRVLVDKWIDQHQQQLDGWPELRGEELVKDYAQAKRLGEWWKDKWLGLGGDEQGWEDGLNFLKAGARI